MIGGFLSQDIFLCRLVNGSPLFKHFAYLILHSANDVRMIKMLINSQIINDTKQHINESRVSKKEAAKQSNDRKIDFQKYSSADNEDLVEVFQPLS